MVSKAFLAAEQKAQGVQPDPQGYITITNGSVEAKIVPSSFPVWDDKGWTIVEPEPSPEQAAEAKLAETPQPVAQPVAEPAPAVVPQNNPQEG